MSFGFRIIRTAWVPWLIGHLSFVCVFWLVLGPGCGEMQNSSSGTKSKSVFYFSGQSNQDLKHATSVLTSDLSS